MFRNILHLKKRFDLYLCLSGNQMKNVKIGGKSEIFSTDLKLYGRN